MKAHRLALPILAAATLLTTGVGVASAAEPGNCADAVTALSAADQAHRDAVAADDKLRKAEDADQSLRDARRDLKDATEKRDLASADVTAKQAELDRLNAPPVTGSKNQTVGTPEQIAAAEKALAEAKKTLRNREDRVDDRQKDVDRAERDAKARTANLRREADKTDAAALQTALDEARDDFNRLCTEGEDDPTDNIDDPAPAPADEDDDFSQVGTVPQGGVQTGGWSA